MGDNRIGAGRFHDHVERGRAARSNHVGLDALQIIGGVPALVDVVPDLTDRMEGRKLVRSGIDEINADTFAGLGIKLPPARHERVVFKDSAVEHHAIELAIEHGLHVVRVLEIFGLHQHIFTIRLRPDLGILRIHDDRSEHATRDVLDHRRRPAMIEKHAGLLRREGEADRFTGVDGAIVLQKIDFRRVEIHRMRVLIRGRIRQRKIDGITFRHPHHRTRELPVERPGGILFTAAVDDDVRLHCGHLNIVGLGLDG